MQYPILRYPDPTKGYVLYTDASGIGWSGVLTQEHRDEKNRSKHHPICYVSGQFRGSQLNWAALTKEAYTIYMSVRRLSFYITDADVLIRCDHLPLKKFLNKQTLNAKVNNWAVELEQFQLKMDWIPGSKNLLADSLSRLMEVVPEAQQAKELEGYEFGSYCFEELKPAEVMEMIAIEEIHLEHGGPMKFEGDEHLIPSEETIGLQSWVDSISEKNSEGDEHSTPSLQKTRKASMHHGTYEVCEESDEHSSLPRKVEEVQTQTIRVTEHEDVREIKLPLKPQQLQQLQQHDEYCKDIARKMNREEDLERIFIKENGIIYRLWTEDEHTFKCILVPEVLQDSLLILAHDLSGHNGGRRTYSCLKRQYYWKGMRKRVFKHCKQCVECVLQNQGQPEKQFSHFQTPDLPMQFICMDLVGPIYPPSSKGNKYVLTVIDMLTGFTVATAIPDKNAETVCKAYRDHVYCIFGGSSRILTDNRTEFKNKEMKNICDTLGIKQIFSPAYTPQSNGRLEGWHRFFKACIAKHIRGNGVEWDEIVPLAVSAYNFFPCQSTRESPFVLMFGRDPMTPFAQLLEPKPKYYGEKGNFLQMDSLRRMYAVVAENMKKVQERKPKKLETPLKIKVNDLVMVKDPDSAVFQPRYQLNYRVTAIVANNHIEVQDEKGQRSVRRSAHVKAIEPKDKIIQQMPAEDVLRQYGRGAKLLINRKDIPNLQLQILESEEAEINSVTIEGDEDSSPQQYTKEQKSTIMVSPMRNGEGDEHSTPSTKQSKEDRLSHMDIRTEAMAEESDEYSTPQRRVQMMGSRGDKSTSEKKRRDNEAKQETTEETENDKSVKGNSLFNSNVGWLGIQLTQLAKTVAGKSSKGNLGSKTNTISKTNNPSQTEFSFLSVKLHNIMVFINQQKYFKF